MGLSEIKLGQNGIARNKISHTIIRVLPIYIYIYIYERSDQRRQTTGGIPEKTNLRRGNE